MKEITVVCIALLAFIANARAGSAAPLLEKYQTLAAQLQQNAFKQPLVLDSVETPDRLTGDVYAVVAYPFDVVSAALNNPQHWCDVLSLHFNTKYCRPQVKAQAKGQGSELLVRMGTKKPQALSQTESLTLQYAALDATPQYLRIQLDSKDGPMGTSDYRILLEAVPLPKGATFLHLTYSYSTGVIGRLAMQTYLMTIGHDKVGFTEMGKSANGETVYVGGVRGVAERNTMRYYLAIDALLESMSLPPASQFESRLQSWFSATERYPRQLHELGRSEYVSMKRAERARQLRDTNQWP
jgi:hypothetical protein